MAQSKRPIPIHRSVGKIRKEMPGNHLENAGSACVLEWPWGIEQHQASRSNTNRIFLVAISQVISKRELHCLKVLADFLPISSGSTLTFTLNNLPPLYEIYEVQIAGHEDISLILIPTEPLHKQNFVSLIRRNKIKFDRPQPCHRGSESGFQASDKLFCYVVRVRETASREKFDLQCYVLETDESGQRSYYLVPYGNKAKLRKLEDFDRYELPYGSVILNEHGEVVGFLAFGHEDEILPVFLRAKDTWNAMSLKIPSEIIGAAVDSEERSSQEGQNKNTANNNQNLTHGLGNCSTLEMQGSGNPADNPAGQLQVNTSDESDRSVQAEGIFQQESFAPSVSTKNADPDPFQPPVMDPGNESSVEEDSDELNGEQELESSDSHQEKPVPETALPKPIENTPESSEEELGSSTEVDDKFLSYNLPRSVSDVFSSSASGQAAQGRPGPIARQNTTPGDLEHVSPGSLVKDKIVNRANIMDVLSLHLDRSSCPGKTDVPLAQRWEQLADEFKVPDDVKSRCENFTNPSEGMFEHLCVTRESLTIGTLKCYLRKLRRKDIVEVLDKNSKLSDETTVNDFCENHPETLCTVCLMLDDPRSLKNWIHLGRMMGIKGGMLRSFQDSSDSSPTECIFSKIKTLEPTLPITEIQVRLRELKLESIAKELDCIKDGTIQTLLEEIDVLENVTGFLDQRETYWRRFGLKFKKIPVNLLDSFRPVPIPSPTKMVMNYIVQNDPNLPMQSFLLTLVKMDRKDVIEELKRFYKAQDIEAILR